MFSVFGVMPVLSVGLKCRDTILMHDISYKVKPTPRLRLFFQTQATKQNPAASDFSVVGVRDREVVTIPYQKSCRMA